MYSSLSEVLVSKGFFRSYCLVFVGVHVVPGFFVFFSGSLCQCFGVRRLLQVLWFGVSGGFQGLNVRGVLWL